MRKLAMVVTLLALATSFLPSTASAQGKVVYIDSYRIRLEYGEFKDAQVEFNKEVEAWNAEVEQGQLGIEQMEADLAKQALILSEAKRKEKEAEIEAKKLEWQQAANEIFGPNGRAEQRNAELTKPLLDKINLVLEALARDNGYDLILDAVNGNIAYGKKDLDITDRVLEELEKTE
ncbi:MAG: OmpH family outer membrane protein [bacterium]